MSETLLKTMNSYELSQNLICVVPDLPKNSDYFLGCYYGV